MLFKPNKKIIVILLTVITLFVTIPGCSASGKQLLENTAPAATQSSITVTFAGDIMTHGPQIRSALQPSTGTYNFNPVFKPISSIISASDFSIANLETTCAGKNKNYSGYPTFNSPEAILPALKNAGFDVLTTANNHCMDRGFYGIQKTIAYLDSNKLLHTGTFADSTRKNSILYLKKNNITLAVIACTYGTNGITVPTDKSFAVNLIDINQIQTEIAEARKNGADFVAVVTHFGTEYQRDPNDMQKTTAQSLANAGADMIIGSHPHVVQPIEQLIATRADGSTGSAIVAYSLGNFISNQRDRYQDSGILLQLKLTKITGENAANSISSLDYLPVWVRRWPSGGKNRYAVLPVNSSTISSYALTSAEKNRIEQIPDELNELITKPQTPIILSAVGVKADKTK